MYSPDERRSIRAEMNRDAAPSAEEAQADWERHVRENGCERCDCTDPEKVSQVGVLMPSCSAAQAPRDPTMLMCDDCCEERETLRERAFRKARRRNQKEYEEREVIAVAFYGCENWEYVFETYMDDGTGETHPHPFEPPHAPIQCRCGEKLDEVVLLSEVDD